MLIMKITYLSEAWSGSSSPVAGSLTRSSTDGIMYSIAWREDMERRGKGEKEVRKVREKDD
jgi:hypothetical protein